MTDNVIAENDTPQVQSMVVSCGACQWSAPLAGRTDGAAECRANPPVIVTVPGKVMDQYGRTAPTELQVCFPTVIPVMWCGRYVPRKIDLHS